MQIAFHHLLPKAKLKGKKLPELDINFSSKNMILNIFAKHTDYFISASQLCLVVILSCSIRAQQEFTHTDSDILGCPGIQT